MKTDPFITLYYDKRLPHYHITINIWDQDEDYDCNHSYNMITKG